MSDSGQSGSARTRALLTETEREQIAGKHGKGRRWQATTRVRDRIQKELPTDIIVLREHHTELWQELREVVCSE